MRVLLASAPHADTFGYSMPPPGLLRLGGELSRIGIDVALEDLAFRMANGDLPSDDGLARAAAELLVSDREPDVLGLSVMGATLPIAVEIARIVRELAPAVRLVVGGPGVGGVDTAVLERFPWFDAVVRGEGEVTVPELLERLIEARDSTGVAGVTWRAASGEIVREADREPLRDLDRLAPYAWELLPPLTSYKAITGEVEGLTPIDSGRGCVFDCSFCTIGRFWSRRSRPLPVDRLVDEIAALGDMPGARNAYLCHDLFGADRAHAVDLCRELARREVGVAWECRARADHLDGELLELMARAGCYRVLLGIESADPDVRRANQKGMRDDVDLLAVVDDCAAAGIVPILSLLLGLPGEDEPALARSLDFCADAALRTGVNLSLHLVNPQPGCGLGDELGATSRPLEGVRPDMAWGAGETAPERELIAAHPDLFTTWALLPIGETRIHELRDIAGELPEVLMRYPRTFSLLRRRRGEDALALWRAWRGSGRGFESFARAARDPLVDDTLLWEQALVRAGARRASPRGTAASESSPRAECELVRADHDLATLTPALVAESNGADVRATPSHFAVVPVEGTMAAVRTLRVSAGAATLLERLDGRRTLETLERDRPGISSAIAELARSGLVTYGAQASGRTT